MVQYRYLGYGTTDANGVAKLDHDANGNEITHSYTGVGVGEVDIVASLDSTITANSVLSEPYPLMDCIFMDFKSTGSKNSAWVASSSVNATYDDTTPNLNGETTVSASSNGTYRETTQLTGDFEATLQAKTNNTVVRVGFTDNSSKYYRVQFTTNDEYQFIKIKRVNSTWTAQYSADGVNWTNFSSAEQSPTLLADANCYFYFNVQIPSGGERSITFKNLRIYPI